MSPSIIIADDHPLILKGLQEFLIEKNHSVEALANDGKSALRFIETLKPDIAILDIQMPHYTGIEIAEICKEKKYKTKIIIITFEKDEKLYNRAKELNIYGYVLKEFALAEIEQCIEAVQANKSYFSPDLLKNLKKDNFNSELAELTASEKRIIKLIAQDKTTWEISDILSVSKRTVDKHRTNIVSKLNLEPKPTSLLIWVKEHKHTILKL